MFTGSIILFQLLIFFILPAYLIRLSRKFKADKVLSDIVICYGIGMLFGNTKAVWLYSWTTSISLQEMADAIHRTTFETAQFSAFAVVLLAIPMLLMINNATDWLKYTGKITLVFFLGVLSAIGVCMMMGYLYRNNLPEAAITSGMLTGVYIGGTPNMVAISKALNANDQLFVTLNATDTLCSGLYFFFLVGFGKALIGLMLPAFRSKIKREDFLEEIKEESHHPFPPERWNWPHLRPLMLATLIAFVAVLLSVMSALLLPDVKGKFNQTVLMLTLTTLGIGLSFSSRIRTLPGVYTYAQYLLLIFGLAAGYMSDFSRLLETGGDYLSFNALVVLSIVSLHLLLTFLLRADTDSFMISSAASMLGPPFVAQVSTAIKNKELLPVGIALSLLGLGIANYAGVLVAWVVERF